MSTSEQLPDPTQELELLDTELAGLRDEISSLRSELVDSGPMDSVDRTAILEQVEEREAVAATLERRQAALKERLEEQG